MCVRGYTLRKGNVGSTFFEGISEGVLVKKIRYQIRDKAVTLPHPSRKAVFFIVLISPGGKTASMGK